MLPGEDGLAVCRRLRGSGETVPIIMLTAKGEDIDRIVGLEMGADDYLPKPFNPRELVARIHAVLRRQIERLAPGAPVGEGRIEFGPYVLDLTTRTLTRNGTPLPMTTGEFGLLKVFVTHARQPLAREKLMLLARGRDHDVFDRAIDVQVSRLRKLIEPDPASAAPSADGLGLWLCLRAGRGPQQEPGRHGGRSVTLWPRSLFGRLALLLLMVVVVSQGTAILLYRQDRAVLVARQFSDTKVLQLQALRAALAATELHERSETLTRLGEEYGARIVSDDGRGSSA